MPSILIAADWQRAESRTGYQPIEFAVDVKLEQSLDSGKINRQEDVYANPNIIRAPACHAPIPSPNKSNLTQTKSLAITGLMVASLAAGVLSVVLARSGESARMLLQWVFILVALALVFLWLRYDEPQFGYRRSPLFNIGIVALAFVFIPYYLYRSRPPGSRLISVVAILGLMSMSYGLTRAGYYLARALTLPSVGAAAPSAFVWPRREVNADKVP